MHRSRLEGGGSLTPRQQGLFPFRNAQLCIAASTNTIARKCLVVLLDLSKIEYSVQIPMKSPGIKCYECLSCGTQTDNTYRRTDTKLTGTPSLLC
jgi:hypothetical protein